MTDSKLKIYLQNSTKVTFNLSTVKKLIDKLLLKYKIPAKFQKIEIGILLVGKDYIKKLNKKYRNINKPTDVLSFAQFNCPGESVRNLGDIIICPEIARNNIDNISHPLNEEILFLIKHGFKHLIGIHHK